MAVEAKQLKSKPRIEWSDDDYSLYCSLLLREVLDQKIAPMTEILRLLKCGSKKLSDWRSEEKERWATAAQAKVIIPMIEGYIRANTHPAEHAAHTKYVDIKNNKVPLQLHLIDPKDKNINTLKRFFAERIGPVTDRESQRLTEYFMYLESAKDEEWWDWAFKGMAIVATKTSVDQRHIGYLIGIYKAWLKLGFGTFEAGEVDKAINIFREKFGIEPSEAAIAKFRHIIADYGIAYALDSLYNIQKPTITDISLQITELCEDYIVRQGYPKLKM